MATPIPAVQHEVSEWSYASTRKYDDPFNDVELDVVFTHTDGKAWRVPAFWSGGREWRVRFAPPLPGPYTVDTVCSDAGDADLHGRKGTLEAEPYAGSNPLLARGALRVASGTQTFEHADGTPFYWLGDTWWMGLCGRLSWPDDFQLLAADRAAKGYSVVQLVAGLYPDMPAFDKRGANEAGFPWEADWARINPAYFDQADIRLRWLMRSRLVPCIVGCWGYYLPWLGLAKMKQHWRNIVARWGAYPVVWCLAGEAAMPYYLSTDKEADKQTQMEGWTELARYVRRIDAYGRLLTIHPTESGRDQVVDDTVLDFDMLQTGHGGYHSVPNAVRCVTSSREREPHMPAMIGEANYEGILHSTQDEVQRLMFWATALSGSAGYTYGANGIWQVNTRERAYGASPHGATWGNTPWEDAYRLPGAAQLGLARALLERYAWWEFEPHPEWVTPSGNAADVNAPFAAGIPGSVRVIYMYNPTFAGVPKRPTVLAIEPEIEYRAFYWDPRSGATHELGAVEPDAEGAWQIPLQPTLTDWVLVLEAPHTGGDSA